MELLFLHPSPDAAVPLRGQESPHRGGPAEADLWERSPDPHTAQAGSVLSLAPV